MALDSSEPPHRRTGTSSTTLAHSVGAESVIREVSAEETSPCRKEALTDVESLGWYLLVALGEKHLAASNRYLADQSGSAPATITNSRINFDSGVRSDA